MNKLVLIKTFVSIVETGGLNAAALDLGIDPSRVSQRLKALEDHLGFTLITRTTRAMALTDAGRTYLSHTRHLIDELDQLEAELRETNEALVGRIAITAPPFFSSHAMGAIMDSLMQKFPKICFDMRSEDRQINLIEDQFDVAVRSGVLVDSSLFVRPLHTGFVRLYASPEYLDQHGTPTDVTDIAARNVLLFNSTKDYKNLHFQGFGSPRIIRADGRIVSNNLPMLLDLARKGHGLIKLPDWLPAMTNVYKDLICVLPKYNLGTSSLSLVYPPHTKPRKAASAVIEHLHTTIKAHLDVATN